MENNRNVYDEIIDTEQDKTTSLSLLKQDITDELKICVSHFVLQLVEKVKSSKFSERAQITGKKFVVELYHDFNFKEDEELLLTEKCDY